MVYATRLEPLETAFSAFGSATTKSYSSLANGNYTFHVKARDQAGNEDTEPATRAFTVSVVIDTLPPNTNITAGPTGTITVSTASFTWSGDDNITPTGDLVYASRLDPLEAAFSAFGSATTKSYSSLANGDYTFHVKARDQAGNEDTTPATRAFTVNVTGGVCPAEITLDNLSVGQSDSQRSFTGAWALSGATGQFGANSLYSSGGGLDTYTWKSGVFHASQACTYRVDVWWTQCGESVNDRADYREWAHRGADDEEL